MIKKPQGYDEAPAFTGESMQLPKGKYICTIMKAEIQPNRDGKEQFLLQFDIAEGEYKDFYARQWKADVALVGKDKAVWKGRHWQTIEGQGLPWFKGAITSIEKSNPGFHFAWNVEGNETSLKGKKFGAVFYRQQFEGRDGSRPFATKIYQIRSIEGLKDAEIPEDRPLPEGRPTPSQASAMIPDADGFLNIPDGGIDEELPFM